MKRNRSKVLTALLASVIVLPLTGCGDDDNENISIIATPTPARTSTPGGGTPVATQTPAATATGVDPTATPDTGETPTPEPTGGACTGSSVVVEVSIDTAYGAARIDLDYPESQINLPGSGPAVASRVQFAASGGLTTVNDDDNTGTLTTSFVGFTEQTSGLFATVTFDCVTGVPPAGAFTCTVVSASTPGGVAIDGATCSVAVE